jgi:iron complex outermembrane receptor protein
MEFSHYRYWLASATMLSAATLLGVQDAAAQNIGIEEIIVTTRNREESLQSIPLSITAFTAADIERQGIRNIEDVARLTPGLTFDKGFAPQDTRPSIRGLPATRGRPPIGILLDGFDVSSSAIATGGGGALMNLRLVDVERIEVVKGPQSALYGRVAFGGAINYVTKKATDEFEGRVSSDVGTNGQAEVRGSFNGPITDGVSMRFNAAYSQHGGFYKNSVSGSDIGGFESIGGAVAINLDLNENLTMDGRIAYSDDESEIRARSTIGGIADAIFVSAPSNHLGLAGAFNPAFAPLVFDPVNFPVSSGLDPRTGKDFTGSTLETLIATWKMEYDFGNNITFTSLTGWNDADVFQELDSDGTGAAFRFVPFPRPGGVNEPLGRQTVVRFLTNTKQFNQEFRIGDLTSDGLRWTVGAQYWEEDTDQTSKSEAHVLFFPGASAGLNAVLGGFPEDRDTGRQTTHSSAYGLLEYDVTDQLTVTGQIRYSDEKFDYLIEDDGAAFGLGLFGPAAFGPLVRLTANSTDDFWTMRGGVEYAVADDSILYASISKGVKPGGFDTITVGNELDSKRFTPETLWNYEIGSKNTFADGRVQFNFAGFFMDYTDKQVTTQVLDPSQPAGLGVVTRNAGAAEVYGLEADALFAITEELTFSGAYTFLDAGYSDFVFATGSANDIIRGGSCEPNDLGTCNVNLSGNALERSAKHSFTLDLSYSTLVTDDISLIAEVSAQYQGNRWLAHWNRWRLNSYWNVDARLGFETDKWSFIGYVENLAGDDTIRSAQENFGLFTFGTAIQQFAPDGRQWGLRMGLNF